MRVPWFFIHTNPSTTSDKKTKEGVGGGEGWRGLIFIRYKIYTSIVPFEAEEPYLLVFNIYINIYLNKYIIYILKTIANINYIDICN